MAETKRVELEGGAWVDLRTRTTFADLRAIELARVERDGKSSPVLDMIEILPRLIVAWSYDAPITPDTVGEHIEMSAFERLGDALRNDRPNTSGLSSSGGRRKAKTETPA